MYVIDKDSKFSSKEVCLNRSQIFESCLQTLGINRKFFKKLNFLENPQMKILIIWYFIYWKSRYTSSSSSSTVLHCAAPLAASFSGWLCESWLRERWSSRARGRTYRYQPEKWYFWFRTWPKNLNQPNSLGRTLLLPGYGPIFVPYSEYWLKLWRIN